MKRFLGVLLLVQIVWGEEPDCTLRQCIAKTDDFVFGDAWSLLDSNYAKYAPTVLAGERHETLRPSLCKAENWRAFDNCLMKCPLALVPTFPDNISMRACLKDNTFEPYSSGQHIHSSHPLHGRELPIVAFGKPGIERLGCSAPTDGKNYSGKIVLVMQGNCHVNTKVTTAAAIGAAACIVVDTENSPGASLVGPSYNFGDVVVSLVSRADGDIILETLDAGLPVRGRLSLDCSVMSDPPPPPDSAPDIALNDCPSELLFGVCGSTGERLCTHCAVQMEIAGTPDSPCLYGNRLLPRSRNSILAQGTEQVVHLASLIPEFNPDSDCKDNHEFTDPHTGFTCKDVKDLVDSGAMQNCASFYSIGMPQESYAGFLENCLVTCPNFGGKRCPGGTGMGCLATDFRNAAGKIVAVHRPSSCDVFTMIRIAESAGVRAVVLLTREGERPRLLDGMSKFVSIPVHTLDVSGSRALERSVVEARKGDPTVTGAAVRISKRPPAPPEPPAPPPEGAESDVYALEAVRSFSFTPVGIIALIVGIVCSLANIIQVVRQRRFGYDYLSIREQERRGLKIPLWAASMVLTLSLLFIVAAVSFSLAYAAGEDATDLAMDSGWAAVERTHSNAFATISRVKDQLLGTISSRTQQGIVAELREGQLQALTAAKLFLTWDGSWDDFNKQVWRVTEMSRKVGDKSYTAVRWKMVIRTTSDFFAAELLKTDDRSNVIRGDGYPHVSVTNNGHAYGINEMIYRLGGNLATQESLPRFVWDPRESLGRSWFNANARMEHEEKGNVVCMTVQHTIPVSHILFNEFGLRPLSCLAPIYDAYDNFVGTAQAHTSLDSFGSLLGKLTQSEGIAGVTVVVFNELGEFVTSSRGRNNRQIESYGRAQNNHAASDLDAITAPIVLEYSQEPYLNAAASYMKGAMGLGTLGDTHFDFEALTSSSESSREFDQAEWYGRGLWTRHVALTMDFEG
eukprot:Hpha_TRINITY_DN33745_c0_g1::TRINITY_DN33745_c0_g1_i1::g.25111::m.25111